MRSGWKPRERPRGRPAAGPRTGESAPAAQSRGSPPAGPARVQAIQGLLRAPRPLQPVFLWRRGSPPLQIGPRSCLARCRSWKPPRKFRQSGRQTIRTGLGSTQPCPRGSGTLLSDGCLGGAGPLPQPPGILEYMPPSLRPPGWKAPMQSEPRSSWGGRRFARTAPGHADDRRPPVDGARADRPCRSWWRRRRRARGRPGQRSLRDSRCVALP